MSPAAVGYSGTPPAKKLGIAEGKRVVAVQAPENYAEMLAPIPSGVLFEGKVTQLTDIVHVFSSSKAHLKTQLEALDYVMECSCSLCRRVGALWHGASDPSLRITAGENELTLYQFNTMTARHYSCRHCGVHPFSRPRLDPGRWAVNVRCIDGLDIASLPVRRFDGANWEAAARALHADR